MTVLALRRYHHIDREP